MEEEGFVDELGPVEEGSLEEVGWEEEGDWEEVVVDVEDEIDDKGLPSQPETSKREAREAKRTILFFFIFFPFLHEGVLFCQNHIKKEGV